MVVVSSFPITPLAAAWRLARSFAIATLVLFAWSGIAPAEHRQTARTPIFGLSAVTTTPSDIVPAGPETGFGVIAGLDWDEPGEDPLKLGRALRASSSPPGGARFHYSDPGPDGIAISLPERPPRA